MKIAEKTIAEITEKVMRNLETSREADKKMKEMDEKLMAMLETSAEALVQIVQEITYRQKVYVNLRERAESEDEKETIDVLIEEFGKLIEFIEYRLMNNLSSKS